MVVAHIVGRGAPELVRFWGETPLVREPDVLLYGIARLDPPEQEVLAKSPLRHITAEQIAAKGAEKSATDALTHSHADTRDFILHLDVDVISGDELPAVNVPQTGGLTLAQVRDSLKKFAAHKNLLGLDIAQFNPDKDPDGSAAKKIVDLLVEALTARLAAADSPEPAEAAVELPPQAQALPPPLPPLSRPTPSLQPSPSHLTPTRPTTNIHHLSPTNPLRQNNQIPRSPRLRTSRNAGLRRRRRRVGFRRSFLALALRLPLPC